MLFNSVTYLIFLPIVFFLYWLMRSKQSQNLVLLLASMVFYGWWSIPFLCLMMATCLLNYFCVSMMQRGWLKGWLALALIANFGVLGLFKYFNFFAENFADLLTAIGLHADMPTLHVILPVGISFYTFQLSAYVIDIYTICVSSPQTDIRQQRGDLLSFLTFISFFPQLVAGPIERAYNLLPQMQQRRTFNESEATDGMRLLLWGLLKKMLIADNCASQVDYIFQNHQSLGATTLWLGALYFTFQIYGDFSGYSDMAIGSARLFGIRLSRNFRQPYFATSMQDFWHRWHMTLMSWLRDYVYIPLGGNRLGRMRQRLNLLAVFLLSGLWHGAGWTFISWGLFHALIYRISWRLLVFPLVVIGWVIFRSPDMTTCAEYLSGMFRLHSIAMPECSRLPLLLIFLLMLTEWQMNDSPHPFQWKSRGWQSLQPIRLLTYFLLFVLTVIYGGQQIQFIYFQF